MNDNPNTYTITKLDEWSEDQWQQIVLEVEDLVADLGEQIEREN
jgi:hypothetical protein